MRKITEKMMAGWLGEELYDEKAILDILTKIANGEYTANELRNDVIDY